MLRPCTLVVLALGLWSAPALRAQTPELRVDSDAPGVASSSLPRVAASGDGSLHVVWQDYRGPTWSIYYRRMPAFGQGNPPPEVSLDGLVLPPGLSSNATNPDIATDGTIRLHVVWHDVTGGDEQIFYTRSLDGGLSWLPAGPLVDSLSGVGVVSEYASPPEILADGAGNVWVTWSQSDGERDQVYYGVSHDHGQTWDVTPIDQPVNEVTLGHSETPRLASDGTGHVYIAYLDHREPPYRDVFVRRSTDWGDTWLPGEQRINGHGIEIELDLVAHATTTDPVKHRVLAAWIELQEDEFGNPLTELQSNYSTDGGASWQPLVSVVNDQKPGLLGQVGPGAGGPTTPVGTAPGGPPPVKSGELVGPPRVSASEAHFSVHFNLELAVDASGDAHIVYSRVDAPLVFMPTAVYHNRLDGTTGVWRGEQKLSRGGVPYPLRGIPTLARATLATAGEHIFAAWMQSAAATEERAEIHAAWSPDGGEHWSPAQVVTQKVDGPGTSRSAHPALVAREDRAALVWDDRRAWTDHTILPLPPNAPVGSPDVYLRVLPTN